MNILKRTKLKLLCKYYKKRSKRAIHKSLNCKTERQHKKWCRKAVDTTIRYSELLSQQQ